MAYVDQTELVSAGPAREAGGLVHRVRHGSGTGPHRTIVLLHGRSGNEDAMWLLAPALPRGWLLIAPRGPVTDPVAGYDWRPRRGGEWPRLHHFADAVAAMRRFLAALPRLYDADPNAISLMGFSQGAATAVATALADRSAVAAVALVAGFVPIGCSGGSTGRALEGLPVFMAVGRRDPLISPARRRAAARVLRHLGAALTYREYDVGHKIGTQGMRDLAAWWAER